MAYEPLHHKYRPQTFAQLVGQSAIATTLSNALEQRRIAPAYLFCGPRGTGKTSSARILAKSLNCISHPGPTPEPCGTCEICRTITNGSALDFVEIDAASNTGVDNIRELIERAQFAPVQCRYKVYVIDECHMLSVAAFNALLKTLEEPPERVVFVLATTDPQRVLPTIISRCQRFDYRRIPLEEMVGHLKLIAGNEGISIEEEAVRLVAQVSQGGLRDAESLLDQLSLLEPPITAEKVWDLVGAVPERDLLDLVRAIAADDGAAVLDQVRKLMDRGREPLIVLQNLAGFYRDLLIAKTAGNRQDLVAITPATWAEMQEFAQALELGMILAGQQHLRAAEVQVRNTTQPRLWLEVTLMGLLPSTLASQAAAPALTKTAFSSPPLPSKPAPTNDKAKSAAFPTPAAPPADLPSPPPPAPVAPPPVATPSPLPPPSSSPPLSSPPSSPPLSSAPSPSPAPTPDLAQLWQRIVAVLQPLGTRALMQQQGNLLAFNGQTARIGINSQPLFKMAQGRITNIEEAFQQVTQQKVKVSLEVMADSGSSEDSPPAAGAVPANSPPPSPPPLPASPITREEAPTEASWTGETMIDRAPPAPPLSPEPAVFSSSMPSVPQPPSLADMPIESDFERAVKSFAQFFNGQVVSADDETTGKASSPKPTDPADSAPPYFGPDSDVPF
ncbi:MAG: DNA polymerase III subunit gamma/tau [Cyanobacteria bacterium Co-bin13]|nr:DNA polymerase III subunit gamma/tau [Cyanobacteria bacterium Co-bin13]